MLAYEQLASIVKDHVVAENSFQRHVTNLEHPNAICEHSFIENPDEETCWTLIKLDLATVKSLRDELEENNVEFIKHIPTQIYDLV